MTFEEFVNFYNSYGKCPNQVLPPNHSLNERELVSLYKKYLKSEDKKERRRLRLLQKSKEKEFKKDEKLEEAYRIVDERDNYKCQFIKKLDKKDFDKLKENSWRELYETIDHAHVFGKGAYPQLKYDHNNIVLLNRYSHSMLDQNRHPITGVIISNSEKLSFWKYNIGIDRYNKIVSKI